MTDQPNESRPILCVDFDGVIHSYTSGWKGAGSIPDPPVEGAIEFLKKACWVFNVNIHSSRSHVAGGIEAMKAWLLHHGDADLVGRLVFPKFKPSAMVTLDDRGVTFRGPGHWPSMNDLLGFRTWWETADGQRGSEL